MATVPGCAEAVAYLRAFRAGDQDTQATLLAAVDAAGLDALVPFATNLAHIVQLGTVSGVDVDTLLDRVTANLLAAP